MPDKKKSIVDTAIETASTYHRDMYDKYGNPYFEHLERVAGRVRDMEYEMVMRQVRLNTISSLRICMM